ncbi:DUF5801 repeats-in-toxin domain-containing protein [Rhizorhapis sp.]|uniref:DUF5801 repeats-in-toxin domain-containing protein n=1 Tax=Rhizorhapis sp. TaxID=1968842 RepID=UPI002B4723EF|nr:DUF5801 repeats-in-toxin domain-containing protein [Rhizorhapis sp.]HKR16816.1 DUF5801 repeats-in-toxin domain-containing protein [Rhizorhapis sp.]
MDIERNDGRVADDGLSPQYAATSEVQALAAAQAGRMPMPADAKVVSAAAGPVVLPEGVNLDDIKIAGRDLIVTLPDGTQMVILDGAVFVPQLVIDGVQVPPANIAALLIGNEPQPAAGSPQSSGGNFSAAEGDIGDPFDLGDLLPPTELAFSLPEQQEIIPVVADEDDDAAPAIQIVTSDFPAGATDVTDSVDEAGLPARGDEPAGSNQAANSETTSGTIVFSAADVPAVVTINGTAITAVGQTITTGRGLLTITSIDDGQIGYSYMLSDNVTGEAQPDIFTVIVTDSDGDTATATLTISIVDDAPTARADTDGVAAGTYGPESGNVLTGSGTASGVAGVDTQGADGAQVAGVAAGATGTNLNNAGTVSAPIQGQFGVLTLNPDGSYTYVRNEGTPGGVSDVFTYTIRDGDGDLSSATLTIEIGNSPVSIISIPQVGEPGTVVDESGLGERGEEPEGSNEPAEVELTEGTITYSAPDGPAVISINGTIITQADQPIAGEHGILKVTVTDGQINYSYEVTDNGTGDNVTDSFTVTVTDADGQAQSKPLVISIVDDVPEAVADTANVDEGATLFVEKASGVLLNDVPGADGFAAGGGVVGVRAAGNDTTSEVIGGVDTAIVGLYGTLTLHADGSYSYASKPNAVPAQGASDVFVYTIEDGDGDHSTATLTIDVADTGLAARTENATVDEAALNGIGSNPGSAAETATGTLADNLSGGTGPFTFALTGDGAGQYGTLTLNSNGSYSYTLNSPVDGVTADDGALPVNGAETFEFEVTDANGNTAKSTITINIIDDVPSIEATGAVPSLTVDESDLSVDASASFVNVFTSGYGADGAGSVVYTLGINQGATGLIDSLTGEAVVLSLEGGQVIGRTETTHELVFVVSENGAGEVSLDQRRAVAHDVDGSTSADHDDAKSLAAANLITLTATVTDGDGDTATATVNIADKLSFKDDGPVANNDSTGLTEGGASSVTFDVDSNDAPGADGAGSRDFTSLAGTYGNLTLNPDGTQTYTLTAAGQAAIDALAPDAKLTDSFSYTLTDKDGDTDTATLTVTLTGTNDPVRITNLTSAVNGGDASVDEDDLPTGTDTSKESLTQQGDFTISAPDGIANLSVGGHPIIVNGTFTATSFTTGLGNILSITDYDPSTGVVTYTYTLAAAESHGSGNGENALFENFAVSLKDLDGDSATDLLSIKIVDDVPEAVADSGKVTEGALLTVNAEAGVLFNDVAGADGLASGGAAVVGVTAGSNTANPVAGNVGVAVTGAYGTLTLYADGHYTYQANANAISSNATDTFVYTMADGDGDKSTTTLTINLADVTLLANDQTKTVYEAALDTTTSGSDLGHGTVTGSGPSLTTETATGTLAVAGATGYTAYSQAGTHGFFQLNADGTYSYTLTSPVDNLPHANDGVETASGVESFSYTAHDANGNTVTGTITIDVVDDVPVVTASTDAAFDATLVANGTFAFDIGADGYVGGTNPDTYLDVALSSGAIGDDPITITQQPAFVSNVGGVVTYGFTFTYDSDPLTAGVQSKEIDGTIAFDPANDSYSVTISEPIEFTSFVQTKQAISITGYDAEDNLNTQSQQEVSVSKLSDSFFVQFSGYHGTNASPMAYSGGANGSFSAPVSYVSISQTSNGVASDTIAQKDILDINFYQSNPGGDLVAVDEPKATADSVFLQIDQFGNSEDFVVVLKLVDPANPGTVIYRTMIADHGDFYTKDTGAPQGYSFTFDNDDAVLVIEPNDYRLSTDTVDYVIVGMQVVSSTEGLTGSGYNLNGTVGDNGGLASQTLVAFSNLTSDQDVTKIVNIGISQTIVSEEPLELNFSVTVTDSDGDKTAATELTVTLDPAGLPVALDLDNDGVEYLSLTAGVTYDYGSGEVQTAWVAPDDGLLAHAIGGSYDIVFADDAAGATTDLEGVRLAYDSNGDEFFTAADAAFTEFGVWQDGNSNGVVEAGEYQSLTALGISSIDLVSDGQGHMAANGDVLVHGEATYTVNGETRTIADVSFATSGTTSAQQDERALLNTGLNQALVAASLIATVEQAAAETSGSDTSTAEQGQDVAAVAPAESSEAPTVTDQPAEESSLLAGSSGDQSSSTLPSNESHQVQPEAEDDRSSLSAPAGDGHATESSTPLQDDQPVTADAPPPPMPVDLTPMMIAAAQVAEGEQQAAPEAPEALPAILADALSGGVSDGPNIDALLDALPQVEQPAGQPVAAPVTETVHDFALAAPAFHFDLAMMSHDAVAATTHA